MNQHEHIDVYTTATAEYIEDAKKINFHYAPFEKRVAYYNNLPFPVCIGTRDGMKYVLQPMHDRLLGQVLYIEEFITYSNTTAVVVPDANQFRAYEHLGRTFAMNKEGKVMLSIANGTRNQVGLQYQITSEEMREVPLIYLENLDLVISATDYNFEHPHSPRGRQIRHLTGITGANKKKDFGFNIEIIDNNARFGSKYINLNNQVYEIPVKTYSTDPPGVYFTYKGLITEEHPASPPKCDYYKWSELDKLPFKLYDTWQEAYTKGDLVAQQKHAEQLHELKIAELKREIELLKAEQAKEAVENSLQSDRRKSEEEIRKEIFEELKHMREKETLEMKRELDELKREQERAKHAAEMQSLNRKDISEFFKWVPALVTGVFTFMSFMMKLAATK